MKSAGRTAGKQKSNVRWMRGCATALVTPFDRDGRVDAGQMVKLVRRQLSQGVTLLVPCGTTGESATMSAAEREEVILLTIETARGRGFVIAGTGSNNTAQAIEQSRTAAAFGADAVLVVAPYYNKPTQTGLYAHFRAVAEAVHPVPVVIYNVPGRTSSNISAQTTLRLAREVENIVAVKEASGNLSQMMEILRERPPGFLVLSGDDALTLPLLALGADGVISVASNEVPRQMSRLVKTALDGDFAKAQKLHYQLLPLMEANFIESSPAPVKAAMRMMKLLEEELRLPLVPVEEATRERLWEILKELKLVKGKRR